MRITTSAYHKIIQKIGSASAEKGGVLLGKDGVVTAFIFDEAAHTTCGTYTLNVNYLNPIISQMSELGLDFMGVLHSHPYGYRNLSQPDCDYFLSQISKTDMEFFYTPIVFSALQGEYDIFPYKFYRNSTIEHSALEVLPDDYQDYISPMAASQNVLDTTAKNELNLILLRGLFCSWLLIFAFLFVLVLVVLILLITNS